MSLNIASYTGSQNTLDRKSLRIVVRSEWHAKPPKSTLKDIGIPSERVIIAHTVTECECNPLGDCGRHVLSIQSNHMKKIEPKVLDIGYNFLVGCDGSVFEGRGWDKEGAHTKNHNERSICIAFIGTFINTTPSEGQLNAAKLLIDRGVRLGKLRPDYRLYGHNDKINAESPGSALKGIIKNWAHYTDEKLV